MAAISSLIIAICPILADDSAWVQRTWTSDEGLPQNSVNAVLQTRDGFLWIGTNGGLARFDGAHFQNFGLHHGLRSIVVMALAEDRLGALWIGTSGGGLSRLENGRITSFGANEGFPTGTDVLTLAPDRDGSLWIGTVNGLVHRSDGGFKVLGPDDGLPRAQVRSLLLDSQGTVWASFIPDGLYRGRAGRFTKMEGGPSGDAYCIKQDRDGFIWAGSNTGVLWKWNGKEWNRLDPSNGLPEANILSITQSRDGEFWVGARAKGLYRGNGEKFVPVEAKGELSTLSVNSLVADHEGALWAASSSGGLHRFAPRLLNYYGTEIGLPPSAINCIVEDDHGTRWAGSASNGIYRFANGRFERYLEPAGVGTFPYTYTMTKTGDGAVWAAGEQFLARYPLEGPVKAFVDPPIQGEAIRALCADGDAVWAGTYYSALYKADANGVQSVAPRNTFPGGITSIVKDTGDALWVGTSEGLHRWENGKVKTWITQDGLLSASIQVIHRDPDGTLWLGTLGGGLTRLRDGRFVTFTTREGLVNDVISQILPDDFGSLWLGSNRGVMRIERKELEAVADGKLSELHPIVLGKNEGMEKEQCSRGTTPNAARTKDGWLLFPTAKGYVEIDPRRLLNVSLAKPQPIIDLMSIDGQSQPLEAAITIPPGKHHLEFNFTAPALRGGDWLRLRYRLEGLDRDWIAAGPRRTAVYEGLAPGHYRFQVAAANRDGKENESTAGTAIFVQPSFWQTTWFRVITIALVIFYSASLAWWSAHRRHRRRIEDIERERHQQAELARASRVSLLGELSASLTHELKQPLAAILSNAQAGLRFLSNGEADPKELREILSDIADSDRRAAEIITRLRAMMKKGETKMEARDLNADIEQVLQLIHSDLVARNVTVSTRLAEDLPPVNGDHIQIQQVMMNLVINASDAMREKPQDERQIVIETAREGPNDARVSVIDKGHGIRADHADQIFEPFYSTKEHGLGMGLSICRAIIRAHGGRLWVTNNPDGGATFHFTCGCGANEVKNAGA